MLMAASFRPGNRACAGVGAQWDQGREEVEELVFTFKF